MWFHPALSLMWWPCFLPSLGVGVLQIAACLHNWCIDQSLHLARCRGRVVMWCAAGDGVSPSRDRPVEDFRSQSEGALRLYAHRTIECFGAVYRRPHRTGTVQRKLKCDQQFCTDLATDWFVTGDLSPGVTYLRITIVHTQVRFRIPVSLMFGV